MSVTEPNVTISDVGTFSTWYNDKRRIHREDGPARIERNQEGVVVFEEWYKNGNLHRVGGPARIERNQEGVVVFEEWYENGNLHRVDGPAILRLNNNNVREEWFEHGILHRAGGPVVIERNGEGVVVLEEWFENGNLHRIGGPARTERNEDGDVIGEYFLYGNWIEKPDYIRRLSIIKRFANTLKNKYRNHLTSALRESNLFDVLYLCNEVAKYVI